MKLYVHSVRLERVDGLLNVYAFLLRGNGIEELLELTSLSCLFCIFLKLNGCRLKAHLHLCVLLICATFQKFRFVALFWKLFWVYETMTFVVVSSVILLDRRNLKKKETHPIFRLC